MKKIMYFICIMLFGFGVKASPIVRVEYQEGIYSNRISNTLYSGKMGYIFLDEEIVYCLDPFELVGKTYYEDPTYLSKIKSYNLEYYELIAYYGYNKTNRNSIYYYMAAQELIWESIIGGANVYWTTGDNGTGDEINIESYKKEIMDNIDNFFKLPSFNNKTISNSMYEQIEIEDSNKILNQYNIEYSGKNILTKKDNKLKIKFLDYGKQTVNISKKLKTNNKTKIYTGTGNQTLAKFGIDREQRGQFSIVTNEPSRKKLKINLINDKTKEYIHSQFGICDTNGKKIETNGVYNGDTFIYSDKMNVGTYNLCTIPEGYLNKGDLIFEITNDLSEEINIDIYLEPIPIIESIKENNIIIKEKEEIIENEEKSVIEEKEKSFIKTIEQNKIVQENSGQVEEEISTPVLDELPNTSNYYIGKYSILGILLLLGIIFYEIEDIRN